MSQLVVPQEQPVKEEDSQTLAYILCTNCLHRADFASENINKVRELCQLVLFICGRHIGVTLQTQHQLRFLLQKAVP